MLSLRTESDWSTARITLDDGGGAQNYDFNPFENSAYDAMEALVAWATANLTNTYSWTWTRSGLNSGALVSISVNTGTFTLVADAEAQSLLGFDASYSAAATHVATSAAEGTWDPPYQLALRRWLRWQRDIGEAGGVGVTRAGIQGTAARVPIIETVGDALSAARLADVLRIAEPPRQGWIYQEHESAWRLLSIGQVTRQPVGGLNWRFSIDARG